jgi:hypothetical protein
MENNLYSVFPTFSIDELEKTLNKHTTDCIEQLSLNKTIERIGGFSGADNLTATRLSPTQPVGNAFRLIDNPKNGTTREEKIQIAQWMGAIAEENGYPPELPVMCALVESSLNNVNYGDRDSEGFFQIRVGIHGLVAVSSPEAQMDWWLREADRYTKLMINSGISARKVPKLNPRAEPPSARVYGIWCQAIEGSAFPDKYQEQYEKAKELLRGGN